MLSMLITYLCPVLLFFGYRLWQKARRISNIPGNLGFPILGNLYRCLCNFWFTWHPSYNKCIQENAAKYGDVSCLWLYYELNVVISDPYLVDKLAYHPALSDKAHLIMAKVGWFVRSVFGTVLSDKEWKLRRKELNNGLRKLNLESFHDIFVKNGKRTVEIFSKKSGQFDCGPSSFMVSLEAIGATNFGMDLGVAEDKDLYDGIHLGNIALSAVSTNPILGVIVIVLAELFYSLSKARKLEKMIYNNVLKKAKTLNPEEDMKNLPTSIHMAQRHLNSKTIGRPLQRELTELLYVGAHTIGISYASALLFLATNPEIQEKVWQEQEEIFGDSDRDVTLEDMRKMVYLERFYKECLRFCSPPIVVKTASSDIEIDGMVIPSGTLVTFHLDRMRFDERQWKNPKVFDPDRFLPENIKNIPKSSYAFYGIGIRSCPGAQYANYILKVMISTVVRNFKLHSTEKFENLKFYEMVMLELIKGYHISVEKRQKKKL